MNMKMYRYTMQVDSSLNQVIVKLSRYLGGPKSKIIKKAILMMNFIITKMKDDPDLAMVLLNRKTGQETEIIILELLKE